MPQAVVRGTAGGVIAVATSPHRAADQTRLVQVVRAVMLAIRMTRDIGFAHSVSLGRKAEVRPGMTMILSDRVTAISGLFEEEAPDVVETNELERIRSGEKPIAVYSFPRDAVLAAVPEYEGLSSRALDAGLMVVVAEDPLNTSSTHPANSNLCVFVLREDQFWRIQPYLICRSTLAHYPWSDAAEANHSLLLGYTQEQTSAWIAKQRHKRLGWVGKTMYLLMSSQHLQEMESLGRRCFPSRCGDPIVAVRPPFGVLKRDAHENIPNDLVLGRVAVRGDVFKSLFPRTSIKSELQTAYISDDNVRQINAAIESRIEVYTKSGWA